MSAVKMGLTIEEAAECTGIGRNTMRKLVEWGKLPVLKVGRKTIIRRDTLERFLTVNQLSLIHICLGTPSSPGTYGMRSDEFYLFNRIKARAYRVRLLR